MKTRVTVALFLIFAGLLGGWIWFKEAISPVAPGVNRSEIFVVKRGESIREIADKLHDANLIRSPVAFFILVRQKKLAKKIQAGDFRLSPGFSAEKIAEELTHGTLDIWVTIPEGWRNSQVALELAKKFNISKSEFLKRAREGYMFPDTYLIPKQASVSMIVKMFNDNFDRRVRKQLAKEIEKSPLSLKQIIILASIVEREAKHDKDRPVVAGILFNRLKLNMPLQADATLQYIKGFDESTGKWWGEVEAADKEIDSPYNTYKYPGLPPAPIANPGLAAIKAAIKPQSTEYLYYISDPDGTMHYAKTLAEHNANIHKYLRQR